MPLHKNIRQLVSTEGCAEFPNPSGLGVATREMIYHYTQVFHLESIVESGLMPSSILLAPGEKPVLWFSTNDHWENTVFPITSPTLAEAHEEMMPLGGLARIGCDDAVAPYRWKEMKEVASIPYRVAKGLYDSAIGVGACPGEWRGTLKVVPVEHFRAIEVYDGEAWIPAPEALLNMAASAVVSMGLLAAGVFRIVPPA